MSYREKLGYELNVMRRDIQKSTGLNINEISYRTQTSINAILLIEAGNMLNVDVLSQYIVRLQEVREEEALNQMFEYEMSNQLDKGDENNAERKETSSTRRCDKSRSRNL